MEFIISHERFKELKDSGLKCFVAVKIISKKSFFSEKKTTTEIVGSSNASNYMWAQDSFLGLDYDYILEVKRV